MAKQLNVQPNIGIRIKLASSGSGKWEESGGDASKFGLTSSELLEALDFLESKGLKDCLKLIHFHIGSQVTKIRRIKRLCVRLHNFTCSSIQWALRWSLLILAVDWEWIMTEPVRPIAKVV